MFDADAPPPALSDRVNGVWLQPPNADFAVVTGADVTALHPDAVAGLIEGPKCKGFVTVKPAGDVSAEAAAATVRESSFGLSEPKVVQDEAVLYCGKTGWRLEVWGTNAKGDPAARRVTFLVNEGRLYGVYGHGDGTIHTRMRRCLDTITAAFEPM